MRSILFLTMVLFISGWAFAGDSGEFAYKSPETTVESEYGYLTIYTDSYYQEPLSFSSDGGDPQNITFTPYKIYRKDGSLVKNVYSAEKTPLKVKLAKGEYVVVAKMSEEKMSSFAVNIEPGQVLEVDAAMLGNTSSNEE